MTAKDRCVGIAVLLLAATAGRADEPRPAAKTDAEKLQGVWLFDGYRLGEGSNLGLVWTSVVTIKGDTFSITKVYDAAKPFSGKFTLDPAKKAIDFKLDEFDLTPEGMPLKVPVCSLPGLYKLDGDTLTVALEFDLAGKRPTGFESRKKRDAVLTLKRAPKDFTAFPKDITVKAVGPDGKPVAGAIVAGYMHQNKGEMEMTDRDGKKLKVNVLTMTPDEVEKLLAKLTDSWKGYVKNILEPPAGTILEKATGWSYHKAQKTTADGTTKVAVEKLRMSPVIVRDTERKQMGVVAITPWNLLTGEVAVKLQPEVRVTAQGTCDEITKAGVKNDDHFGCYIQTASGSRIAFDGSKTGKLEFLVPPGEYQLMMYGTEAMGMKFAKITVPANQSEYTAPPVDLPASGIHTLIGKTAPELAHVVGWKGEPVKLANLKGKYVLLEFWGYWCGPCIGSMPDLFKIHDEFKGKDVVIVGVHVDSNGEVTTTKQLDDKLVGYKKDIWKGRDIPFPVALTSGKLLENDERGGLAKTYGIRGYPSTILIDRAGKVVGNFRARDGQAAIGQLKKLLAEKK